MKTPHEIARETAVQLAKETEMPRTFHKDAWDDYRALCNREEHVAVAVLELRKDREKLAADNAKLRGLLDDLRKWSPRTSKIDDEELEEYLELQSKIRAALAQGGGE